MTTVSHPVEGEIGDVSNGNSASSEDETEDIVLNFSDTNNEVSLPPAEESKSDENQNEGEIAGGKFTEISSLSPENEKIAKKSKINDLETKSGEESDDDKNNAPNSPEVQNEILTDPKIQKNEEKILESNKIDDNDDDDKNDAPNSLEIQNENLTDPKIQKNDKRILESNKIDDNDDDDKNDAPNSPKIQTENLIDPKIQKNEEKILESNKTDDDDDDDNFSSFKFSKKSSQTSGRKFTLIDSDSGEENDFTSKKSNNTETNSVSGLSINLDSDTKPKPKSRITNIWDSESDDGDDDDSRKNFADKKSQNVSKSSGKKLSIIDSSSENESKKSSDDDNDNFNRKKKKSMKNSKKVSSARNDLIDSDNSESDGNASNGEFSASNQKNKPGKSKGAKRKGTARASKDAAMQQIYSESQRLVRESEISLPYHRPKQRTLQEFLNRKNISASLPKTLTTAAKVKMCDDIIKAVEEKEKEAEEFYKSSDSEEEELSKPEEIKEQNSEEIKEQISEKNIQDSQMDLDFPFSSLTNENNEIQNQNSVENINTFEDAQNRNIEKIEIENQNTEKIVETENHDFSDKNQKNEKEDENKENLPKSDDKNISHVSRKLFDDETENEESAKEPETNGNEEQKNTKDNTQTMETDTNDFELRFSVNDFDTELYLKVLENPWELETTSRDNDKPEKEEISLKNTNEESVTTLNSNPKVNSIDENPLINFDSSTNSKSLIDTNSLTSEKEGREDDELADVISRGHVLGLPPPSEEDKIIKKKMLKQQILSRFLNVKPTLRGSPGMTIELSEEKDHEGVKKLLDRFVRHSHSHKIEENPDVSVVHTEVTPEGLKITEQVLPYKISRPTEESDLNKPGAKLQKLREQLQQKIFKKRNEEWRQKEEASKELDEEIDDEELEPEDKLPPEIGDDESAESEPEENDVLIKERKKSNHAFADDEAEVSDDDENQFDDKDHDEDEENEEDEEEEEKDENEENNEEEKFYDDEENEKNLNELEDDEEKEEEEEEEKEEEEKENDHPKKLRRITAAFQDDSDQEEESKITENSTNPPEMATNSKPNFRRTQTDVDMFDDASDEWNSEMDLNPTKAESSQSPQLTLKKPNLFSPISQLSIFKNMPLTSKTERESSSPTDVNGLFTQESLHENYANKLFATPLASAVNDDELMNLCSGNFATPATSSSLIKPANSLVTESQILDLCSGSFASEIDETSQDMKLTLDEASKSPFKSDRKFQGSPKKLKIISSDDEDEDGDKKPKRKIMKLVLSDDEEEKENEDEDEEEEEEESDLDPEDEERFIDYDSEENEMIIPKAEIGQHVAKKFLEAEAELSESEWGSEDEDEKDLDKLEKEAGDDDEFDEDQMRNQLGKIHARQVQDDDQRDVRLLQDMLFEDGDLHSDGAGRERKFRWKNIDNLSWGELKTAADDGELIDDVLEDQNELELRKRRYEKEKFLDKKSQESVDDIQDDLNDSEIFKCGLRVVNTIVNNEGIVSEEEIVTVKKTKKVLPPSIIPSLLEKSSLIKSPSAQLPIRGSFLARGDATLARIASIIDEKDKAIRVPLNGRRFVFEHISPTVKDAEKIQDEDESPSTSRKSRKRTSTSDSTPKSIKKMKVDKGSSGKKLFS